MRIVALTDIHGGFRMMQQILEREHGVDLFILGGDITTHGTPATMEEAVGLARRYAKPVLAVAGNMDPPALDDCLVTLGVSINGRGVAIEGIGFFGVSASPLSPLHTPNEVTEDEIMARAEAGLREVGGTQVKVFVPHAPPFGTILDRIRSGKSVGSKAVLAFIEKHQPDVTICGHIHEARGVDRIGRTQIINCGYAAGGHYGVIDVGTDITLHCRTLKPS